MTIPGMGLCALHATRAAHVLVELYSAVVLRNTVNGLPIPPGGEKDFLMKSVFHGLKSESFTPPVFPAPAVLAHMLTLGISEQPAALLMLAGRRIGEPTTVLEIAVLVRLLFQLDMGVRVLLRRITVAQRTLELSAVAVVVRQHQQTSLSELLVAVRSMPAA